MAFLRIEPKKSGTYLLIVQSFKQNGVTRHKTNTHSSTPKIRRTQRLHTARYY